jgi:hydrogenase-1 operon protein HyaF
VKDFPIPVVAIGPGTQAVDEPLDFMPFPGRMDTFVAPPHPQVADPAVARAARTLLEDALARARRFDFGGDQLLELDFGTLPPDVLRYVNEALGAGEVAAIIRPAPESARRLGAAEIRIQETAFPAFWRVLHLRGDGSVVRDLFEVGDMPHLVAESALAASRSGVAPRPRADGVMNAPPILAEVAAASARYAAGGEGHIVNFTLLPVSPEDMQCLVDSLGVGPATILSRGYGACRITSTLLRHVWWVQYFNSMNQMILNTLEVARVPEVALAARDDFEASLARLAEWVETLE